MDRIIYRLNLNKASNRLDQFENKRKQKKMVALGFYFLVVLAIGGFAVFKTYQTQDVIKGYETELARIDKEIKDLKASSEYLSPEDIFALAEMANGRITWTEKLNVLGRILPDDVAITELSYDETTNTLMIKGVSRVKQDMKDLDLVVSIINLIKSHKDFAKDFSDIKFSSSNRIKHDKQEMVEFEIACIVG